MESRKEPAVNVYDERRCWWWSGEKNRGFWYNDMKVVVRELIWWCFWWRYDASDVDDADVDKKDGEDGEDGDGDDDDGNQAVDEVGDVDVDWVD